MGPMCSDGNCSEGYIRFFNSGSIATAEGEGAAITFTNYENREYKTKGQTYSLET
jgi:hypothetical protein